MENKEDIVKLVSNLLDSGNYKEALLVPNEDNFANNFKDNCWELVSVIIAKINDDTIITKPSLLSACEQLLGIIVKNAAPEEVLLEFVEQIELAKNDSQFCIILTPLQTVLKSSAVKRITHSLEWCLNAIISYVKKIPVPEHQLEGKERILMDSDINVRRINKVYSLIPPFLNPSIHDLTIPEANITVKQTAAACLIRLLGKPIIYLELDAESNLQSEARTSYFLLVQDICKLEKNAIRLFPILEVCYKESLKPKSYVKDYDDKPPYENRERVNLTTLSSLFYALFSENYHTLNVVIPQVYSIQYLVHTLLLSVVHLLTFTEYGPLMKGICLGQKLLKRLPSNCSHDLLSSIHFDLCKNLVNIAIYSTYDSVRKNAVNLIGHHINKFEYNGRCKLIKFIISMANHSGMIGYAITIFKSSIDEAFKEESLPDCFKGQHLKNMIKTICHLPFGAQSDLVELADQIITSLNFLRYLAIKDTNNKTGICDSFKDIETDYLDVLRTALNMSKAHYEVKLKDIEEGKNNSQEVQVSINVAGNLLDQIPNANKKEIINSALNAFHLIEGLVARLSECININKMQTLSMDSIKNGRSRLTLPLVIVPANHAQKILARNYSQNETEKWNKIAVVNTEHDDQHYEDNVKTRILERALEFVPKSGWSVESISDGAEAAGYPSITHGLFPNGGGDLVHYFNVKCNEKLLEHIKNWPTVNNNESKVPTSFVENAITTRLFMIEPYKTTWPKAMAIQTLPNNVPNCLATLLSLVDDICYHSGDRSVDFNWYIRRVGLAGIYKVAELFYLTDKSPNNTATRSFVSSRIRDAMLLQSALNLNPVSAAPQTLTAAFVTAKNILGMNTLK